MELAVVRDTYTSNTTTGKLYVDGVWECFSLEPRADQSQGKPYCIPEGRYLILLQMSAHFVAVTPHLQNVPGFTAVEIHPGNYAMNTEGCTLVGETRSVDFVGLSDVAFGHLMTKLNAASDPIWITYSSLQITTDPELDS